MSNSRRDFLKLSSLGVLGFTTPIQKLSAAFLNNIEIPGKDFSFGLQLWTVKEDMAINAKETLQKVASDGYHFVESFEGKQGMFWGMGHKAFKSYLDELKISILSSHCDIQKDFERKAAEAAEIGMKYLICPYKGPQKSIDDFKRFAEEFNEKGAICKKNGIRFAYHNHDYSWKEIDGQIPQVVMMDNTDKELVDFEMDIYWVVAAGIDPQAYLQKYAGRFRLCHVKDLIRTADGHESCILGKGTIDFHSILKTAKASGTKYYIVEQEAFTGTTPLLSAAADASYLQHFKF